MITGVTLIKNGNMLGYPWKHCISSMLSACEQVIVNCDPGEDNTLEELSVMAKLWPIQVVVSRWDMKNTGDGRELARQINNILPLVQTDWTLYLQADELIHERDASYLNELTDNISSNISQIELWRTYFWESLQRRHRQHEISLGRLFRTGTHTVGGDGMFLIRNSGEVFRSGVDIYHYSRMGNEEDVTKRIRTLDLLFHDEKKVETFPAFTYNGVDPADLITYYGPHPRGIKEFYGY